LDYDDYWNPDITANIEGFELLSQAEYKELLRQTGFFIQESQRSIFDELNHHKKSKEKKEYLKGRGKQMWRNYSTKRFCVYRNLKYGTYQIG
jgi:DNA-binding transcriptional regulator YhcF (GntR family)